MRRNPILLAGVLLALLVVIVLLARGGRGGAGRESERDAGLLFPDLDTSRVDRIEIRTPRAEVGLFRDGAAWKVATEDSFPADPEAVGKVLAAARDLSAREIVSRKPDKYDLFEVDSARAVEALLSAGEAAAARFFIGKSGEDFRSTYVRDASREEVFRQADPLRSVFDRGTRTWKDKAVFRLEEEKMAALELEREGETIRLENRGESEWAVTKPEGHRPIGALGVSLARGLTRLTCIDIVSMSDSAETGLDAPLAIVRIDMRDEPDMTLLIGAEKEGGGGRYVKRAADDVLYLVPGARVANYLSPADELIEPVPPDASLAPPPEEMEEPEGGGAGDE
ncbi:MAG: DUF4340 domain-containing protein [Candidatus Eisenbacteria bacterium]